jgi:hypothetical protein
MSVDFHSVDLSGRVDWWKFDAPTPSRPYGKISIRTTLERDVLVRPDMYDIVLDHQTLFLSIKVNQQQAGKPAALKILETLGAGEAHFLCVDGKMRSWKQEGKTRRSLEFSLANARVYGSSLAGQVNLVRIYGRCHSQKDYRLLMRESYRVPGKQDADAWKKRFHPVFMSKPVSFTTGQSVYVRGRLAAKTPGGENDLFTIASYVA